MVVWVCSGEREGSPPPAGNGCGVSQSQEPEEEKKARRSVRSQREGTEAFLTRLGPLSPSHTLDTEVSQQAAKGVIAETRQKRDRSRKLRGERKEKGSGRSVASVGRGPCFHQHHSHGRLSWSCLLEVTQELGPRSITRRPSDGGAHGPEGWGVEGAKDAGEMDPPATSPWPEG